ncbi:MAG: TIGR00341 family protein [Bacteroidetes bacterium]|uniref:TIGR00341 family protein n=1 Tax=Phaeocystidibacter marisrubri TaxID=1577780 RepID=A0A6L3ZEJ8_9FLAO|nr:TIGR00341 family protein [Phaeocystidibacter marisrubri]KAB2815874.1 TIGR00341 family protein [Phaeocystidibacter marisrubri]TNE31291.1 MAG: TIGR00341 family protein [Bacteroidota bacterium]GGH66160.1 membrane protein [Phaeocystidibacter marisrubri]
MAEQNDDTSNTPKDPNKDNAADPHVEEHVKEEEHARQQSRFYFRIFLQTFTRFLRQRLSIIDNADPSSTIEGIEKDVEFRGFNLWILIFSIIICSIGLNTNSTPVVIGAMLISPLMGPIMGTGLAIGVNDVELLKRSLRNLGIAVGMAIIASTTYFLIMPFGNESDELLARTQPTLLDVLIAIFGGATGILAGSRREKSNVIPGVAIATALMPPLCTAGYGIATGELSYFFGAIYLFLINSIFIGLTTTLVVRYLKYPVRKLPDPEKERKTKRIVGVTIFIFVLPSIYIFYNLVMGAFYEQRVREFIDNELHYKETSLVREQFVFDKDSSYLSVVFLGKTIPVEVIESWKGKLPKYKLDKLDFHVFQGAEVANEDGGNSARMAEIVVNSQSLLSEKDREIQALNNRIEFMEERGIPKSLIAEILAQYDDVLSNAYAGQLTQSALSNDTICTVFLQFKNDISIPEERVEEYTNRISRWLETRGLSDSVWVSSIN